ncbi:MAG TPA: HD domain-containing protein [Armatimonadetes bacterium]|nr:HD domain-containing protein [Armatimonadota bacterium]
MDSHFLLRGFSPGSGNGPKLRARVWDRTGEAALIAWDWEEGRVLADGPYRVVGSVGIYAGSMQLCAERVEPCPPDADLQDLLPSASRPVAEMWEELERRCAECGNVHLRALLSLCLADAALCDRWRRAPAAVRHHHAYAGGLLEHTLGVAEIALTLASRFPHVDRDLLLTGALLHDIGKVEAYRTNAPPEMTDRGRLLGHVYPGARIVDRFIDRLEEFPAELRDRVLHLIGSHHGDRAHGVFEVPKMPEAIVLHFADNVDAKMNAVLRACEQAEGQAWTAPVRSLDDERLFIGSAPAEFAAGEGILDQLDDPFGGGLFARDDYEE